MPSTTPSPPKNDFSNTNCCIAFISTITAVLVTMIAFGVQDKGIGPKKYELWPSHEITFRAAFLSVTNIIFAYGKSPDFITRSISF